ncbi:transposase, IS110 family [Campylobacter blaseri]|uniref:IS110 family transposase n=1 Tax=Campylobacter blaseri TaxID=2042961 RepID=A0A2P8R0S2_9BACT|nr:transposase [Campylobacter blaseri]PSM52081.1 IS110 family transposase [Campylobacter blaseri]PSM53866.1 IS110 family transposase [Campylobacter blaseri]QKF85578.1 transposase, IS110 family [Campylobacter blaseri]
MQVKYYVGVDVSKNTLDICFLSSNKKDKSFYKIPNNQENINSFFNSFKKDEIIVCFESTNNYHIELSKFLTKNKIVYSELSSFKTSLFLKHLSHIKTDITDSYGIAYYCANFTNDIIASKYNSQYKLIKSYHSTYNLFVKMQTQIKNFEKSQISVNDEILKDLIKELKLNLTKLLNKIELITYEILKKEIPQTEKIVNNNKGLGKNIAITLFPVLYYSKDKNYKQIISYLGLSPRIYESGISVKKNQHINKIGNSNIRKALFLSALSCIRFNPIFKNKIFYT